MRDDVVICRCEDVTYAEIAQAMNEGLGTTEELKRILRCGMGPCQGRTCTRLIAQIIAEKRGLPLSAILYPLVRPPTRPVEIGILAGDDDEKQR
jgi:bacterioferritin-associated ferredoxin